MDKSVSTLRTKFKDMCITEPRIVKGFLKDSDFVILSDSDTDSESDTDRGEYFYSVMSIDIGIKHLGISVTTLDENYKIIEVVWIDLINITEFVHKWGPDSSKCELYHTKTFCDWLNHVFQENMEFFDTVDHILIERQPIHGITAIEQLIFSRWRDKAVLVHPRSVHKYFNMGNYDYEGRKKISEKISKSVITDARLLEQLEYYDRSHDIADSILIMLYWLGKKQKILEKEKRRYEIMNRKMYYDSKRKDGTITIDEMFESWRYIP